MRTLTSAPHRQSQPLQAPRSTQFNEDSEVQTFDNRGAHATQRRIQNLANDSQSAVQLKSMQMKMQSRAEVVQRVEEEELLQVKCETAQRVEDEEPLQGKFETAQREEKIKVNNTGMPNQLKAGIESISGMSMDHVRVHYNSNKPAQLNAHAYAQGSEIHVGTGQEQHLPHEAWHVVQQAQGRVKPTMQMKEGVPVNDDSGLEHEADVMGAQAVSIGASQRKSIMSASVDNHETAQFAQFSGQSNDTLQSSSVTQLVRMRELPLQDGYASLISHPSWPAKAEAFEKRLGVYAYSDARATGAVDAGLAKMKAVIDQEYQDAVADADEKKALYREVFTKDDTGSAGQVGTGLETAEIETLLTAGNTRERMTAFYNAAYYNSPAGGAPLRGFKQILSGILFDGEMDKADTLGLNRDDLEDKSDFLDTSPTRALLQSTVPADKAYLFADDPFALGNLTLAEEYSGTVEMGASQAERVTRPVGERAAEQRTADDYDALGLGLSDREKAYTAAAMGKAPADADYGTSRLPWMEGHTYYKMQRGARDSTSWMHKIKETLKMPVVAGVSGTTTRMLTAYKWLGCPNPENFRLALMGWMLPAWDHSLYEMMRGSHLAGIRPAGDSDLSSVIDMYMNIAPLTQDQLRANVAVDKMFPHEEVYMERHKATGSGDADALSSAFDDNKTEATTKYNNMAVANPSLSKAHSTAILNYTSGIHSMMNAVLSMPKVLAKKKIKDNLVASARYAMRFAWLDAHRAGLTAPELAVAEAWVGAAVVETIDTLKKGDRIQGWMAIAELAATRGHVDQYIDATVIPWIDTMIDPTYEEMKIHSNMTVEGLRALPPVAGVEVWRGDWTSMVGSNYSEGKTITHNTLTSYSRNPDIAKGFATSGSASYKVLIHLPLTGHGGRDVDEFSKYPEDEVLMIPGSQIRIDHVGWGDIDGEQGKICEASEV